MGEVNIEAMVDAAAPYADAYVAADTTTPVQIARQIKVSAPTFATACLTTDTRQKPTR